MEQKNKIYRICKGGIFGPSKEMFFGSKEYVEHRLQCYIGELRNRPETLKDQEVRDAERGNKNFEEMDSFYYFKKNGKIKTLKCINYVYEVVTSDENGIESDYHSDTIELQEIELDVGNIIKAK